MPKQKQNIIYHKAPKHAALLILSHFLVFFEKLQELPILVVLFDLEILLANTSLAQNLG